MAEEKAKELHYITFGPLHKKFMIWNVPRFLINSKMVTLVLSGRSIKMAGIKKVYRERKKKCAIYLY